MQPITLAYLSGIEVETWAWLFSSERRGDAKPEYCPVPLLVRQYLRRNSEMIPHIYLLFFQSTQNLATPGGSKVDDDTLITCDINVVILLAQRSYPVCQPPLNKQHNEVKHKESSFHNSH